MTDETLDGGGDAPDPLGPVFETEHPLHVLALTLELSHLRSAYIVGRALYENFPDEGQWVAACNSPDFLALVDEFAQVIHDVRQELSSVEPTPQSVASAVEMHFQRAMLAVDEFSALIGIKGEDLLRVLTRT